jgi:tripartite-type tricarboxylate transporter receptor subunit TctC
MAPSAEIVAQAYPTRPIRMVAPLAPGGGTDTTGRIVSQKVAEQMGATIVIENRPGASTIIGTDVVAKWTADGGAGSARLGAWMRPGSGL